jgi:serine/threonine-protein kinase
MSLPRTITEPLTRLEPTRAPPGDEPTRPRTPARFRVALVPGAPPQPTSALETQLRKRLRLCAIVVVVYCAVTLGIALPFNFQRWLAAPLEELTRPPWPGLLFLIGCLEGVLAARLSPRRPTGLARLRALEWLSLTPVIAYSAWGGTVLLAGAWQRIVTDPVGLAIGKTNPWALMAVAYGVLIPNTWRRSATMVGLILLAGLLPDLFVVLGHGVPGGPAFLYLTTKALWLGVAGAIAVYGSYRIEVLREEVLEARRLGQYLLKQRLGAGGMGEVYLAEHVLLRRPCAIKVIRPVYAGDAANLRRFEREVQTTATLTHPNTVQIFDYGHAEDGTFYYAMEYLPGQTLDQLVKQHGPLGAARAVHFLRQVCGALGEAHAAGLIHRDIKPGNVMVCERGGLHDVAKLLDFGLVLVRGVSPDGERLTQEGAVAGTPAYLSPEQAMGREDLDARSDLYSVGCLAYFLLTGRPPFAGRAAAHAAAAHIYEPPAPPTAVRPDVPADLESVVLRCLAKDPAERFAGAQDLDRALGRCGAAGQWTEAAAANWWQEKGGSERAADADAGR